MIIPFPLMKYDGAVTDQPENEIWVRGGDYAGNVAQKIIDAVEKFGTATMAAIGGQAVNQAVKGFAVARTKYRDASVGRDLYLTAWFSTIIDAKGQDRSRIMLVAIPLADGVHSVHQS